MHGGVIYECQLRGFLPNKKFDDCPLPIWLWTTTFPFSSCFRFYYLFYFPFSFSHFVHIYIFLSRFQNFLLQCSTDECTSPSLLQPASILLAGISLLRTYHRPDVSYINCVLDLPSFLDSWPLKMEQIGCSETSVRNYHHLLRNNPEEHNSHLLRGETWNHACDSTLLDISRTEVWLHGDGKRRDFFSSGVRRSMELDGIVSRFAILRGFFPPVIPRYGFWCDLLIITNTRIALKTYQNQQDTFLLGIDGCSMYTRIIYSKYISWSIHCLQLSFPYCVWLRVCCN